MTKNRIEVIMHDIKGDRDLIIFQSDSALLFNIARQYEDMNFFLRQCSKIFMTFSDYSLEEHGIASLEDKLPFLWQAYHICEIVPQDFDLYIKF